MIDETSADSMSCHLSACSTFGTVNTDIICSNATPGLELMQRTDSQARCIHLIDLTWYQVIVINMMGHRVMVRTVHINI